MHEIPQEALWQIAESAPRAMPAYLLTYQQVERGSATIARDYIELDKSMSWTKYKNDLKSLARLGLLEWHQKGKNIVVRLDNEY